MERNLMQEISTKPSGLWLSPGHLVEATAQLSASAAYVPSKKAHPSLNSVMGFLKRSFDVSMVLLAAPAYVPVMLAVAAAIKLDSKGPVFFVQKRVGLNGEHFYMYKFRSMRLDAEELLHEVQHLNEMKGPLFKIKNDPRITRMGRFIRKSSLDELPQLINVLKGEMSLVGPRPPLVSEVEQFEPAYHEKFAVRPGITGLWQVSGRSERNDFKEAIALDVHYVRNWSLRFDLAILLRTVLVVLKCEGAS